LANGPNYFIFRNFCQTKISIYTVKAPYSGFYLMFLCRQFLFYVRNKQHIPLSQRILSNVSLNFPVFRGSLFLCNIPITFFIFLPVIYKLFIITVLLLSPFNAFHLMSEFSLFTNYPVLEPEGFTLLLQNPTI
jgi:hypothetical protein